MKFLNNLWGSISRHLLMLLFISLWLMLLALINLGARVAINTTSTNTVVKQQSAILQAIKDAQLDNRLNSDQKTNTIICMLQVPINERTTDTLNNCRKAAEANPSSPSLSQTNNPTETNVSPGSSSLAPTTNNSQKPTSTNSPGMVTQGLQAVNRDIVQPVINFVKGIHL